MAVIPAPIADCTLEMENPVIGFEPITGFLIVVFITLYPKNEINTPAATAEPITPEILLAMQY